MTSPVPPPEPPSRPPAEPHRPALPSWVAALIVFLASGAVLVLEIVALRLIAPYVGITLETNTAVIGAALAGISLGAWLGGRVADDADPRRLLPPLLVISGIAVLLSLPVVRFAGEALGGGDASGIILLAGAAAFVPAAMLSAVPPMVVKLQLRDLRRTGEVVGRLSGIGTLGAIVATFVTGFVLVAAFPTTAIVLTLGLLLVLAGVALFLQLRRTAAGGARGLAAALLALPAAALTVSAGPPCDVETAYHCASIVPDESRGSGRVLEMDTLRHSYVDLDDPRHLEFSYIQAMASVSDVLAPAGAPFAALHIGGGGVTLPRYIVSTRPTSTHLVLELDGGVVDLDRKALGLRTSDRLRVRVGDGRVGLQEQPTGRYSLVVGDAFGGVAVPWHLTTRELMQEVRRVLTDGGIYAANVIDHPPSAFARAEVATLRSVFAHTAIVTTEDALGGQSGANFVLLGSDRPLPLDALRDRLRSRGTPYVIASGAEVERFAGDAEMLTDDHAPVDQLLTPYGE